MGLYAVPQSADVTDPTVAAAVARWKLRAPKPEAITGMGTGAIIVADATIALHLESGYDAIGSALGDRATLPLLQVDANLDKVAMCVASLSLFQARGYERKAGADTTFDKAGDWAETFLARCRPSGDENGKTENPRFVDSAGNVPLDAPIITSALGGVGASARSDSFIDARASLPGAREYQ